MIGREVMRKSAVEFTKEAWGLLSRRAAVAPRRPHGHLPRRRCRIPLP